MYSDELHFAHSCAHILAMELQEMTFSVSIGDGGNPSPLPIAKPFMAGGATLTIFLAWWWINRKQSVIVLSRVNMNSSHDADTLRNVLG